MEKLLRLMCMISLLFVFNIAKSSIAADTITPNRSITHPETIISAGGRFELGFFSTKNNTNYYLGIWYKTVSPQTVVWVANRENPMLSSSASVSIDSGGNVTINDGKLSYHVTNTSSSSTSYGLLSDSGNFILIDQNYQVLWQSFDYPTDTLLPGMKLRYDPFTSSLLTSLVSWKSSQDPAPGVFSLALSSLIYWSGAEGPFKLSFSSDDFGNSYLTFAGDTNDSTFSRVVLDVSGQLKILSWTEASTCRCGAFSICNMNAQKPCRCLPGFKAESNDSSAQEADETWAVGAQRCVRKTQLGCNSSSLSKKDGFKRIENADFPINPLKLDVRSSMECESASLSNCSWIAYAFDNGSCLVWDKDLFELKQLLDGDSNGKNFFLKLAASELNSLESNPSNGTIAGYNINRGNKKQLWIIVILTISLIAVALSFILLCVRGKLRRKGEDLLLFDLGTSLKADSAELTEENKPGKSRKNEFKLPFGYMSPEYALEGLFSIKSDVFSFGVLLLEIVSGKKNTGFYQTASLNLLGYELSMANINNMLSRRVSLLIFWLILSLSGMQFSVAVDGVTDSISQGDNIELILAADTITPTRFIHDGGTLVSSRESFELGFFSPGSSMKRYLGIWYKKSPETVVWVANRKNPIIDRQGVLTINNYGNLVLLNKTKGIIWSSNTSGEVENPVAQLLDTGNLVLRDNISPGSGSYLWQSFDYPSDTLLPGMKLGWDLKTGVERYLTSWKSADDPSYGDFTYRLDIHVLPQIFIYNGSMKMARTGLWNGVYFGGVPGSPNLLFEPIVVHDKNEIYYRYESFNNPVIMLTKLNHSGFFQRLIWKERSSRWDLVYSAPDDLCEIYGKCSANSVCSIDKTPICEFLQGFMPKSQHNQTLPTCVKSFPSDCKSGVRFMKFKGIKLPDLLDVYLNESMSLDECKTKCLKNCSCSAYANFNVSGGRSCLMWYGDLIDIRNNREGHDIYIRVPAAEPDLNEKRKQKSIAVVSIIIGRYTKMKLLFKSLAHLTGQDNKNEEDIDAWLLWNEARALELMDSCLEDSCIKSQVLRCVQVSLLCVQKFPAERPAMSSVVFMLANKEATLPQPRQPVSNSNTSKLNISDLIEKRPLIARA
ncbi:hypothetical protein JRO89_XS15G0134700 [Xanthoceras sorbifolium]|uniref:Receptor-like serine/threonine-protein kinase n=1 Tax=Xanthoceras sorbifolium TaxID=99658 RepID=A0ABQ8H1Z6_9ROSI|nr:hypothetical protein JRO89_XS15G0134700 [Xanthoceras sorbifolium]